MVRNKGVVGFGAYDVDSGRDNKKIELSPPRGSYKIILRKGVAW